MVAHGGLPESRKVSVVNATGAAVEAVIGAPVPLSENSDVVQLRPAIGATVGAAPVPVSVNVDVVIAATRALGAAAGAAGGAAGAGAGAGAGGGGGGGAAGGAALDFLLDAAAGAADFDDGAAGGITAAVVVAGRIGAAVGAGFIADAAAADVGASAVVALDVGAALIAGDVPLHVVMFTVLPAALNVLSGPTCRTSDSHVASGSPPGPFPLQCVVVQVHSTPPALSAPFATAVARARSASNWTAGATFEVAWPCANAVATAASARDVAMHLRRGTMGGTGSLPVERRLLA